MCLEVCTLGRWIAVLAAEVVSYWRVRAVGSLEVGVEAAVLVQRLPRLELEIEGLDGNGPGHSYRPAPTSKPS